VFPRGINRMRRELAPRACFVESWMEGLRVWNVDSGFEVAPGLSSDSWRGPILVPGCLGALVPEGGSPREITCQG
jgi:hypothetical protein